MPAPPLRFALLGCHHIHAFNMVNTLVRAGGELVAFHSSDSNLVEAFAKTFGQARRVTERREILEDAGIPLVLNAEIPDQRAPAAVEAMRHGKDVFVDKPGAVSLEQLAELREVQRETGRLFAIYFAERLENAATLRAVELAAGGAVGRVLHVAGLGPHRLGLVPRPEWFYQRARSGGILADLACHQVDQLLHCTGARTAQVVAAQVANWAHPEHPELEDFGELLLRSEGATGYARVDWFTPEGLGTWGDLRLTVMGSEGTLEVRKNCDLAGREGGNHLFVTDREGVRHEDCAARPLPFGPALLADVRDRTQTALSQALCFEAMEVALRAQAQATRLGHLA